MPDTPASPSTRLDPATAWTVVTDAPLKGLALAREAGLGPRLGRGRPALPARPRGRVPVGRPGPGQDRRRRRSATTGRWSPCSARGRGSGCSTPTSSSIDERPALADPLALAVDPHGRYVAVALEAERRPVLQPARQARRQVRDAAAALHLVFVPDRAVPDRPAAYGTIVGDRPGRRGAGRRSTAAIVWNEPLMSGVGRLATTGDGGDDPGELLHPRRPAVRPRRPERGGLPPRAARPPRRPRLRRPDDRRGDPGRGAGDPQRGRATSAGGPSLPRPAIALEVDALGRYFVYGQATGEIVRLDLQPTGRPGAADRDRRGRAAPASRSRIGSASVRVARLDAPRSSPTDEQAETAVLAVLDDPPRIGVITQHEPARGLRRRRASGWARPPRSTGSAGSCGPPPAGSPRRPTARSSSATCAGTPPSGSTSAWSS